MDISSSLRFDNTLIFQALARKADYLILKIGRSIIEDSDIEINPGMDSLFKTPGHLLRELEPLIGRLLFAQMAPLAYASFLVIRFSKME